MQDVLDRLKTALADRYAIQEELGAGGMATVYLAEDLKHHRKVAVKVLRPELAAVLGAERFLKEIEVTANLQHPHILPLFDSGEADSFLYYVMPHIQGESLRDKLNREKQLAVEESVEITKAVASALDYAHRHDVIHRDIKPENILMHEGQPVVADFGIALAVSAAGGTRITETGLSLGTPHYMSPEQAMGDRELDARSDVYSLGCVAYEMLAGEPPHTGPTAQAVLAKILMGDAPAPTTTRASIPANVDAAIRKALEKLPADRFTGVDDFAKALADPGFRHGETAGAGSAAGAGPWKKAALALTASTVLFGAVATSLYIRPGPTLPVERFANPFAQSQRPTAFGSSAFALSPDGSMLVYRRRNELWVRRWDDPESFPVRGTNGGFYPAVSYDNTEIAFRVNDEIRVVAVDGGPVRPVTPGTAVHWGPDGDLYVTTGGGIVRVPATGGVPELVTPDGYDLYTVLYDVLPGGKGAIVATVLGDVRAMDLATGEMALLTLGATSSYGTLRATPSYAESGHLVYLAEGGTLMAAPFDAGAMELLGPAVPVLEGVVGYSLSDTGKLFYSKGDARRLVGTTEFVWMTRTGQATVIDSSWTFDAGGINPGWSLSPDGKRLAYRRRSVANNEDIWIKDLLPDGPNIRITLAEAGDGSPRWSPDGERILYTSDRGPGANALWSRRADGSGVAELEFRHTAYIVDGAWCPDEDWIVLRVFPLGNRDIVAFRPGVDSVAVPLLVEEYDEKQPACSPDGRWLAYVSNETGNDEVYVRPFPDVDDFKIPVSTNGGIMPVWSDDGRELFFVDDDRGLVAAQIDTDSGFQVTEREILFTVPGRFRTSSANILFDVSPDGQRFLMARTPDLAGGGGTPIQTMLINNFFQVLKERVPN
ncbi:MAG: protein kinase [Gemmatimonadetes bacterium]|nr:protein kinase [Gemmatimonadota bacterium]